MPEGPEIHRAAADIAAAIEGERLEVVSFGQAHLVPWEVTLTGASVESVEARGKAILTRLDVGYSIYSHNQLYGKWFIRRAGSYPNTGRTLRLELRGPERVALLYSASEIEVLRPEDEPHHVYLGKLGPDALDPLTTIADVVDRMRDRRFARRGLGALLLDQAFVGGLGNYLRTEILWWAGLHPSWRPKDLAAAEQEDLARWILDVSRQSYDTGGITDCLVRAQNAREGGARRSEYRHAAFARASRSCYECGGVIEKIEVGSRRLYLCSTCQPAPVRGVVATP